MTWQPIETYGQDGTDLNPVVLRPHCIHGAMDVRRMTDDEVSNFQARGVLARGIDWRWVNGDYSKAWPDSVFLPFWMPLPAPPAVPR